MWEQFEIAVVGGGASGLMAALAAAREAGRRGAEPSVAVLEKNPRVGKKLLMTGNGRCNLTNRNAGPQHYRGDVQAASPVLNGCPPEKVVGCFRSLGLFCRELDEGRFYPYSLQAGSVLNILRRGLERSGVRTFCEYPVESIRKSGEMFLLFSKGECVSARRVILATGGKACPQSGSSGDGYALLGPIGHSVTPLRPALVQLRTDPARVRPLQGVRCEAEVSLLKNGAALAASRGEVQFAQGALSGICVFELSRFAGASSGGTEELRLDLAPEFSRGELAGFLAAQAKDEPSLPAAGLLEGLLHKSLAAEVGKAAGVPPAKEASALTEGDCGRLADAVKDFRFPVLGTLSWQNAQVTAGGIPFAETDGDLQSRKCKGLYLCGEILNLDGGCGGYNLHWAWASGLAAGKAAADSLVP